MQYIEAIHPYFPEEGDISVFAGGGISNCRDWQQDFRLCLEDEDIIFLNPRRKNFSMDDPDASKKQIEWEADHLCIATIVVFWFSPETLCPITLFELGTFMRDSRPIVVGIHPDYKRKLDVETQVGLYRADVPIVYTVEDMGLEVRRICAEIRKRRSGGQVSAQ